MKYLIFIGIFAVGFLSGMGVLYFFDNQKSENGNNQNDNRKENYSLLINNIDDDVNVSSDSKKEKISNDEKNKSNQKVKNSIEEKDEELNENDSLSVLSDTLNVEDDFQLDEDSLLTVEFEIQQDDEGVVVRKEKIIHSKKYKIKNLDEEDNNKEIDSLIEKSVGIKKVPKNEIWVEFWQSPLSSKGYIYRNLKVKLYGIDPQLPISFYNKDDQLYLKTYADLFHLKPSDEFQKFIFVSKDILKD